MRFSASSFLCETLMTGARKDQSDHFQTSLTANEPRYGSYSFERASQVSIGHAQLLAMWTRATLCRSRLRLQLSGEPTDLRQSTPGHGIYHACIRDAQSLWSRKISIVRSDRRTGVGTFLGNLGVDTPFPTPGTHRDKTRKGGEEAKNTTGEDTSPAMTLIALQRVREFWHRGFYF